MDGKTHLMEAKKKQKLKAAGDLGYLAYRMGMKDNIFTAASSMVYSTLMALVPGFTFLYSFFGAFGVLQSFVEEMGKLFAQVFGQQAAEQFLNLINTYTGNAMRLGVVGLLSFLVTMVLLINKVWNQVNRIFRTSIDRNLVKRILSFVTFLIISVLVGAAYISIEGKLNTWYARIIGRYISFWDKVFGFLAPASLIWFILFMLTYFVPNVRVQGKAAFFASLYGTIAMMIANLIFSSLTTLVARYSVIYGSFAALFLFLLWMYFFWVICFWVVEFTYVYQFRPDLQKFKGLPQSPALQLSEGINIMMLIASNFRDGKGVTETREIIERLAVSEYRLYGFLDLMTDLKFITPTNNQHTSYTVARPLEDLKVQDLAGALYSLESMGVEDRDTAGESVAAEIKEHGITSLGDLTIENLLQRV
ncbi:MAG: YihY/virulence factor BrkB family protein [Sphaerochaetaceae bacterium]